VPARRLSLPSLASPKSSTTTRVAVHERRIDLEAIVQQPRSGAEGTVIALGAPSVTRQPLAETSQ
jgi:hypothetical protein